MLFKNASDSARYNIQAGRTAMVNLMKAVERGASIGCANRLAAGIIRPSPPLSRKIWSRIGLLRLICLAAALAGCAIFAEATAGSAQSLQNSQSLNTQPSDDSDAYTTTVAYVEQFYPLWFTYGQFQYGIPLGATNAFVAAEHVTPLYHFVVAINNDTLYTSIYFDLRAEPVIVTIPATTLRYTTLTLDPYGTAIEPGLPAAPGVYAFTGPEFSGTLPKEVTQVPMTIDFPSLYIRTVKYSPTGENLIDQGIAFQKSLLAQPLSAYLSNPLGGGTKILPESDFAVSFKLAADGLIALKPIAFLKQLQQAVAAPNTPPLSADEQDLSDHFNELFGSGDSQHDFSAGAQAAHAAIMSNYLTNTGSTNWIHFTNISNWGGDVLDRSSITEFLQLANGISTAAYYHTFSDSSGRALNGSNPRGYVLTFPAGELPDAALFWSLTAYTPYAIELIPNRAQKYVVASYLPDLEYNSDGSLSIYISTAKPPGVPTANWLPVLPGPFNIMLRVYGPQGDVADNTYVPPGIQRR
jgi:hypothetical protein